MGQDYIWLIARCDEASGIRWAAFFSFLLHCIFIIILATTTIFFPPQGHHAKPEVIWFTSELLPDSAPSAPSTDSVPLAELPAPPILDPARTPTVAPSDMEVNEPAADNFSAPVQQPRESAGTVAQVPESEPAPEIQVAVNVSPVQSVEQTPDYLKPNLTERLPVSVKHGMDAEEILTPAQALPSMALRSKVSLATPSQPLPEEVPVREIYPVAQAVLTADTMDLAPESVQLESRRESGRTLSGIAPVQMPAAVVVRPVTTTQASSTSSASIAEPAREAPGPAQRETGNSTMKAEVTKQKAPPSETTAHLRQPFPQQADRPMMAHAAAITSTVPQPPQPPSQNGPATAPTPAPQAVFPKSSVPPVAQPEQLPAQVKPSRDEIQLDEKSTKKAGSSAVFAPPLSGDLKLEISGETDVLNKVKTVVIFRAYPRSRHAEPMKKADFRKSVVVTPARGRTSAHTIQEVIEIAREGIYDFRNVTEGGEAEVTFSLKIHENSGRTRIRPAGTRKTGDQGTVVKVLMPEGIVWDDKEAFTGSFEDAASITKFNTETGVVWKEYRE